MQWGNAQHPRSATLVMCRMPGVTLRCTFLLTLSLTPHHRRDPHPSTSPTPNTLTPHILPLVPLALRPSHSLAFSSISERSGQHTSNRCPTCSSSLARRAICTTTWECPRQRFKQGSNRTSQAQQCIIRLACE